MHHFLYVVESLNEYKSDSVKRRGWIKYDIELATEGAGTGDGGYISTCLCVCFWALLIVIAKAILNRNRLLHSLEGIVRSDSHN